MKKMNLFGKLLIAGALSVSMLAGCGSANSAGGAYYDSPQAANSAEYYAVEESVADYDYGFDAYETKMDDTAGSGGQAPTTVDTSRKLITTSYIDVETKEFDQLYADIENYVNASGGYLESINTYNGSRYYGGDVVERHADLTVRIPADKLDDFIKQIGNAGNITNRSQTVEDITLTYVDLEAHKKTLRDEEARLEEFLREAETIEDMIYIEDRLANVRYQIESMESQLRTYDNKINYSTVYLNISEVVEYTPVIYEEPTTWERMKDGFSEQLEDIARGFRNFAVWFVSHFIYLIFWAVVIFAIVKWIIYLNSDKRAAKKAAKAAAKQKAQYEAYQNTMNVGHGDVTNVPPANEQKDNK